MAEQTQIHFMRVRQKGDDMFYDPLADIRVVLGKALQDTDEICKEIFTDKADKEQMAVLASYLRVFDIRLHEDQASLEAQIDEFKAALGKINPSIVSTFLLILAQQLILVYAVYTRRDAKADPAKVDPNRTALISWLKCAVPEKVFKDIIESLRFSASETIADIKKTRRTIVAVAAASEFKVVDDLKTRAAKYLSVSGPLDWSNVAAECDNIFRGDAGDSIPKDDKISLALSYPDYPTPYTEVDDVEDRKA